MSEQQKDFIIIGCIVCGCLRLLVCVCIWLCVGVRLCVCVMTAYDLANWLNWISYAKGETQSRKHKDSQSHLHMLTSAAPFSVVLVLVARLTCLSVRVVWCVCVRHLLQLPGLTKAHVQLCGFVCDTTLIWLLPLPSFSPTLPCPSAYWPAQPLRLKLIAKCKLKARRPKAMWVL